MGKSRGGHKGDLPYAIQPGIPHETLHHYDTHDPGAEGKLSLDDPANNYLAKSKIVGTNGNADAATVRRLGAHVSGLPTMFAMFDRSEANLALGSEALLTEYGSLAYPPGSCYEYSNIGFAALSAIASNLTGVEIGTLMTRRVLTPLGLDDSFFDTNVARLSTGAVRYDSSGNPIPYYTTSTPASGELYASAHDLALFAMFNMNNRDRARILGDRWIGDQGRRSIQPLIQFLRYRPAVTDPMRHKLERQKPASGHCELSRWAFTFRNFWMVGNPEVSPRYFRIAGKPSGRLLPISRLSVPDPQQGGSGQLFKALAI